MAADNTLEDVLEDVGVDSIEDIDGTGYPNSHESRASVPIPPIEPLGGWVSPNMYNKTFVDGELHKLRVNGELQEIAFTDRNVT